MSLKKERKTEVGKMGLKVENFNELMHCAVNAENSA